jgi:hypothetical protein
MNTVKVLKMLVCLVLLAGAVACADAERYTPPANTSPQLEMCNVHFTFSISYYEEEGYVWDQVHIRNGQDESIKVLMLYADNEAVASEHTLGHLSDRDYDIFINKGSDIDVYVQYQDADNHWVDCPGSPAYIEL